MTLGQSGKTWRYLEQQEVGLSHLNCTSSSRRSNGRNDGHRTADLLKVGAFGGMGIALGGVAATSGSLVRGASAQDAEPKLGGTIAMSLADDDVQNFDPIIPSDNMSIWTMLLIYDQLIRVGADGNSLEPGLAGILDVSDDGLIYTFHPARMRISTTGPPAPRRTLSTGSTAWSQMTTSGWAFLYSAG